MQYKVELLTGIRPTGDLTIANYLGAVAPIIELQAQGVSPVVFVANLHAITDNEPAIVRQYLHGVVADYIALGIDPKKANIYLQSDIAGEITTFTAFLARLISVSELLRVPTLKDKLKNNARPETANALLFLYPVLMAADILLNKAKNVPVGEDQLAHMEVTRLLANRFNKRYGDIFPIPQVQQVKSLRILSVKGDGKMSKTNPGGAIFLTDDLKTVANKIKVAETAFEGVMNEKLESHILIAKGLAKTESERSEVDAIIESHKSGKPVMGQFKQILTRIIQNFIEEFQTKRAEITRDPLYIPSVLEEGSKVARKNATETLGEVRKFMQFD
ncbi:MAG: Tryptophan-tRNA ligase [Candidatus Falkowbacteria bacterium GW2011_GWC2_38_22]|uniref:Tryptophan--tRNA ligase n=1 Tax=Candidatus Falkowbacteria bacterium GW2011_GWE1_38_31 TaxID=1618638 RepID=A0A0G0K385_9BACT|nr:MAG: Tryptophan-tRNA ligase [Candidatus Falkowbacteria bacterium GW2011_GWF2_38_1205]KKQ61266.1 MAG: Tryptophan-tRNA ligase [Candidatus Falkowbacteria bacterium GW2011_GWC2_38_22]KKQ63162.1 MAG: Tryptophan-tRNA ligase [Candidatus Falkowbacteria bacterium GW2011_GWF1_38_22]KKQ65359.1 MAG: Tryptophan-tRNA ligase [Candidatus Falkowbacteria bacterium GW2011_GWE2_38_254]KKQ69935.1 MAG: Tryptophan-tRNA ligase [Candidatus Falkowbacteria bacterium GW2011_GWE1_38_31]KKQ72499.1 MAG: Tryptophan-tRNA l